MRPCKQSLDSISVAARAGPFWTGSSWNSNCNKSLYLPDIAAAYWLDVLKLRNTVLRAENVESIRTQGIIHEQFGPHTINDPAWRETGRSWLHTTTSSAQSCLAVPRQYPLLTPSALRLPVTLDSDSSNLACYFLNIIKANIQYL